PACASLLWQTARCNGVPLPHCCFTSYPAPDTPVRSCTLHFMEDSRMSTKPVIAINADYRPAKKDSAAFTWIDTGYYDCVTASGGIPFILPPLCEDDDLRRVLNQVDGVVLTGC